MSLSNLAGRQAQATVANGSTPIQRSAQCSSSSETLRKTELASPVGVALSESEDIGFFEGEGTDTRGRVYRDFILFVGSDHTSIDESNSFADADASTIVNHGSASDEENDEWSRTGQAISQCNERTPPSKRATYYDAIRDAIQQKADEAADAVETDSSNQSQLRISRSPPPTPYLRPLELWENTYERHEAIAYRFEQSPHLLRGRFQARDVRKFSALF